MLSVTCMLIVTYVSDFSTFMLSVTCMLIVTYFRLQHVHAICYVYANCDLLSGFSTFMLSVTCMLIMTYFQTSTRSCYLLHANCDLRFRLQYVHAVRDPADEGLVPRPEALLRDAVRQPDDRARRAPVRRADRRRALAAQALQGAVLRRLHPPVQNSRANGTNHAR